MKKFSHLKKKIRKDSYNLDVSFCAWLEPRLKEYLKEASKVIDLSDIKQTYNNKEHTQKEAIEEMISLLEYLNLPSFKDDYTNKLQELLELWKLWCGQLWW